MITGVVNHRRQPLVTLDGMGVGARKQTIAFLVDTGFNGGISLPHTIIQSLGFPENGFVQATLADGRQVARPTFEGNIAWDDSVRPVNAIASASQPLLGMTLLVGYQIIVDMVDGGTVTLKRL